MRGTALETPKRAKAPKAPPTATRAMSRHGTVANLHRERDLGRHLDAVLLGDGPEDLRAHALVVAVPRAVGGDEVAHILLRVVLRVHLDLVGDGDELLLRG